MPGSAKLHHGWPIRSAADALARVAYRQARRDGASHHAAMDAAERSLQAHWPELSAQEASDEVVPNGNPMLSDCEPAFQQGTDDRVSPPNRRASPLGHS
jgi:hypothetical protein